MKPGGNYYKATWVAGRIAFYKNIFLMHRGTFRVQANCKQHQNKCNKLFFQKQS